MSDRVSLVGGIDALAAEATQTVKRKHAMTCLGPGDYLLPSNDAQTLWRIATYDEDGGKKAWGLYRRPMPRLDAFLASLAEWGEGWEPWDGSFATRAAAVAEALAGAGLEQGDER